MNIVICIRAVIKIFKFIYGGNINGKKYKLPFKLSNYLCF